MSEIKLYTKAELNAEKAENLRSFSGLKLLHIKRHVSSILAQIGKEGIFDEYTKHDISHINYMLESLEWLIPEKTQEILTPSDWLMLTLSIYFHDLGMLVTKDEFSNRNKSEFPKFKASILDGLYGLDFKEKVITIKDIDKQERFIYQELVRKTHAERIKYWILEEKNPLFVNELSVIGEIKKLLTNADNMFRRDLALICESHHLNDLDDYDKYKPNQQYGTTDLEKVNLHYCALILRTADLMHITSDRTPSIEYHLINPTDPISQEEWAKQRAVKTVRPKLKKNKEGKVDATLTKDTLEIIALFENEEGFFGLISYLNYAKTQLIESLKLNEASNRLNDINYEFPWRDIDDSSIETKDFEKRQFEFILDQTRILDLLVGHTLYNDSSVVLRELAQNGIDASKLMKYVYDDNGINYYQPEIEIEWKSEERILTFMDNGTGMTLEIIQNHLLKVGSSRYQDETFKKKFPNFSSISRFGIGLLTCFLIADDIDIITKSHDSEKVILLKIKKIHGKYLLKYVPIDSIPSDIQKHGTIVKLYVRSEVNLDEIEFDLKKWILFPSCKVFFNNNGTKIEIGYHSPKEFLTDTLKQVGFNLDDNNIKVKEVQCNGVTLAFALRYVEPWKEWNFLEYRELNKNIIYPIGTCVEGIRVDFRTPGFEDRNLYAIVNSVGKNAPKTNVARSNIEITPEREAMLLSIYELYLSHITEEIENLKVEGFSITWAASEGNYLLRSFANSRDLNGWDSQFEDIKTFEKALSKMNLVLIEKNNVRQLISVSELTKINHYWTIDCVSYFSANSLIKEIKSSNTSALSLLKNIFGDSDSKTDDIDVLLCNNQADKNIERLLSDNFQVDSIRLIPEQRRLDLRWSNVKDKIWEEIQITGDEYIKDSSKCYIQLNEIDIDKSINQTAINSSNALFILKNSELNNYLVRLIDKLSDKSQENQMVLSKVVELIKSFFYHKDLNKTKIEEYIESRFQRNNSKDLEEMVWSKIDKDELITTILKTKFVKYDTTIWYRRNMY